MTAAPALAGTWSGALDSSAAYVDRMADALPIVYALSPELSEAVKKALSGGQKVIAFGQAMASGTDAQKAAAIAQIVQWAIDVRVGVTQSLAEETKHRFDSAVAEERRKLWRKVVDGPGYWPYAILPPTRIHEDVKGRSAGEIAMGVPSEVWGRVFKPEDPGLYRFLPTFGQLAFPSGCGDKPPPGGVDVEGTWQESCSGEVALYALLWPCFREVSLSKGGEYSTADDPDLACFGLQQRVLFDPAANLLLNVRELESVVSAVESRFWGRVAGRKSPITPWPKDLSPENAGILGTLGGLSGNWAGLQVLDAKPKDAQHDQRFYVDAQGVIRPIWRDSDLDTCYVQGEGVAGGLSPGPYDPDTGWRARCTIRARNTVWSAWRSINTARKFWSTRPYIREQKAKGTLPFPVSQDAEKDLAVPLFTLIAGPAAPPSQASWTVKAAPAEAPLSTATKVAIGIGGGLLVAGGVAGGVIWYRRRARARSRRARAR